MMAVPETDNLRDLPDTHGQAPGPWAAGNGYGIPGILCAHILPVVSVRIDEIGSEVQGP
jgi:hypothetical protein